MNIKFLTLIIAILTLSLLQNTNGIPTNEENCKFRRFYTFCRA